MKICVYCVNQFNALTTEHVIPKMFYPKSMRVDDNVSIKAEVCHSCNTSATLPQEQMRAWFSLLASDTNKIADSLVKNEVKRSFQRKEKLKAIFDGKLTLTDLTNQSGKNAGKAAKVQFTDRDWSNMEKFLDNLARGVTFDVHKKVLPREAKILHVLGFEESFFEPKMDFLKWLVANKKSLVYRHASESVYASWSGFIPETNNGLVASLFYEKISFISFIFYEQSFPEDYEKLFKDKEFRIIA